VQSKERPKTPRKNDRLSSGLLHVRERISVDDGMLQNQNMEFHVLLGKILVLKSVSRSLDCQKKNTKNNGRALKFSNSADNE
jgi:hypothetical protein